VFQWVYTTSKRPRKRLRKHLHCFTSRVSFVFVIGKIFTYRAQKQEITYVRMEHSPLLAILGSVELSGDTCTEKVTP